MRNDKIDYSTRLLLEAKVGRNRSFLELADMLLPKIFPMIFSLVPREKIAIQILLKVFCRARKNIHKIENEAHFVPWLKNNSVMECFHYLKNVEEVSLNRSEVEDICQRCYSKLNDVEKEFLLLSCKERVTLTLTDILDISTYHISRIMRNISEKEVLEYIRKTREKLIRKFPFDEIKGFNEDDWAQLNQNLTKLDEGSKLDINDSELELIDKYLSYSKSILNGTLRHLIPAEKILLELREKLLKYSESIILEEQENNDQKIKKKPKEEPNRNEQNNQVISSNRLKFDISNSSIHDFFDNNSKLLKRIVFILTLGVILYFGFITLFNSTSSWIIEESRGSIKVNSAVAPSKELNNGDLISTESNANLTLNFSNSAYLKVFSDTKLKIVSVSPTNNVLELLSGKIAFNSTKTSDEVIFSDERFLFVIKSTNTNIFTTYSNFNFEKSNLGFDITVSDGWLKLENNGRNVFLVKDYKFAQNLAAPYHINTSKVIVEALTRNNSNHFTKSEIENIIQSVDEKDAITLWHLLYLTSESNRKTIIEKLDEFYPISTMGFSENILRLDEVAMNNLKEFLYNNIYGMLSK